MDSSHLEGRIILLKNPIPDIFVQVAGFTVAERFLTISVDKNLDIQPPLRSDFLQLFFSTNIFNDMIKKSCRYNSANAVHATVRTKRKNLLSFAWGGL
jgi:hypothetical protein